MNLFYWVVAIIATQWQNPASELENEGYVTNVYLNYYNGGYYKDYLDVDVLNSYYTLCPFLYLEFIYERIFATLGLAFENRFALDPEIKTLVLFQNYALDLLEPDGDFLLNTLVKNLDLALLVPTIDLRDFLVGLNKMFGLIVINDKRLGKYILIPLRDIVSDTNYNEWTNYDYFLEYKKDFKFENGFHLELTMDSSDEMVKERQRSLEGYFIGPQANDYGDLPANYGDTKEVRFVANENRYYFYSNIYDAWRPYSDNFFPYKHGNEELDVKTEFSTLHMSRRTTHENEFQWLIPEAKQKGSSNEFDLGFNPYDLRLLFYRGMQENSEGDLYPLGSSDVFDFEKNKIANYRLTPIGDEGLYNQWWKQWVEIREQSNQVLMYLKLPLKELVNFDFTTRKRYKNQMYFVDEIEFVVELGKGMTKQKQTLYKL